MAWQWIYIVIASGRFRENNYVDDNTRILTTQKWSLSNTPYAFYHVPITWTNKQTGTVGRPYKCNRTKPNASGQTERFTVRVLAGDIFFLVTASPWEIFISFTPCLGTCYLSSSNLSFKIKRNCKTRSVKKIKPMTETFFRTVIKAGEKLKFILTKSLYASRMIHHEVLTGIKIQPNTTVSLFAVHTNLMMLTNFNCFQINTTLVSFLPNSLIPMFFR